MRYDILLVYATFGVYVEGLNKNANHNKKTNYNNFNND